MARPSKDNTDPQNGLHFFVILAHRGSRGAYVSCWINFQLHEGALMLAKYYIRTQGWKVRSVTTHGWLNRSAVPIANMKYFREAKKDGASFLFHSYKKRNEK